MSDSQTSFLGTFVIPHYVDEYDLKTRNLFEDTLEGIFSQTDKNWKIVIVDDCSTDQAAISYLKQVQKSNPGKITVHFLPQNVGPGVCRNIGVLQAVKDRSQVILFNDSDDVSHPQRLEVVRDIFQREQKVDVIYSTFTVIDENNLVMPFDKIPPPIKEILESHKVFQLEGENVWIRMGIETGYTNKTSSTATRTHIAYNCPFPSERASEDYHTWMRMSAFGAYYKYTNLIPSQYRIPSFLKYQMSRNRLGPKKFNMIKSRVDSDGFSKSIEIALLKGTIHPEEVPILKLKFFRRLSLSMEKDNEISLAQEILKTANKFSIEHSLYTTYTTYTT